jgi:aryl-alcohol dehydrogenase-like predicted oxidoreductase
MSFFSFGFKKKPLQSAHGMKYRLFGSTGIQVSELGYGCVKLGRNTQVKYPSSYDLPDAEYVTKLLDHLQSLGVNLLDTSPAYGKAEAMIGQAMKNRSDWIISTKAGEVFDGTTSRYYFTPDFIKHSVERSLNKLRTDYIDIFMLHLEYQSELTVLQDDKIARVLDDLKSQGIVRATGASIYTVKGGKMALERYDGAMVTSNPNHTGEDEVIAMAEKLQKGILIKKCLGSGNLEEFGENPLQKCFSHVLNQKGTSSAVVASLTLENLTEDAEIIKNL